MKLERFAGILMHPTSLPGKYGIGCLDKSAFDFIDFLKNAGQSLWQILPLSPTSFGDSPYQGFSTFAGNTLLISPDELIKEGFLPAEIEGPTFDPVKIDYGAVIEFKEKLYKQAYESFKDTASNKLKGEYKDFMDKNTNWLEDYTLFMSLKRFFIKKRNRDGFSEEYDQFKKAVGEFLDDSAIDDYYFGGAWVSWPKDIRERDSRAIYKYSLLLSDEIKYETFLQFIFFRQWAKVKEYANDNGIRIIGDIPIYIAFDSADCWSKKGLFNLAGNGFPLEVAGVPPDYFSETGQLWGNPLYNWKNFENTGFKWWIDRIEKMREICDYIRIDHFRGFDTYWSVPFGDKTAQNGCWKQGPRNKLLDSVLKALGELPIIAEDLGEPAATVDELRKKYKLPGMKVLQFAFDSDNKNLFLPHNFTSRNCVVYTGTHDNDTSKGWYEAAPEVSKDYARRYMNVSGEDISWDLIRLAYSSIASFAVVPLQDCLSLGTEARLNMPSVASGNWQWRYTQDMLTDSVAQGLKYLTKIYGRENTAKGTDDGREAQEAGGDAC